MHCPVVGGLAASRLKMAGHMTKDETMNTHRPTNRKFRCGDVIRYQGNPCLVVRTTGRMLEVTLLEIDNEPLDARPFLIDREAVR